jgi:hypothetical protein
MPEPLDLKKQREKRKKNLKQARKVSPQKTVQSEEETPDQIQWTAPEFTKYQKNKSWLLAPGVFLGLVFLWAVITDNFIFAIVVALSYFLIVVYAFKEPNNIKVLINTKGIKIDQIFYPYENLKSFWLFYDPPRVKELSIRSKKNMMPYIKIPIEKTNPVKIRRVLIKYIPEKKQEESVIENLAKFFRF